MPFGNIEEALELANINILSNNTNLLYVIKIPLTNSILYENIIIKPIIKNDSIINLNFEQLLLNKNEIYAIDKNCRTFNKIKICKRNQLIDLSNDRCIKNIISGGKSFCTISNTHHVPRIEEIAEGLILLNNVNETISTQTMKYDLSGTFLIKISNASIEINNKRYQNLESPYMTPIPAIMQEAPIEEKRLNLLSLESLQELHLNNIKAINRINKETWISNTAIATAFLAILVLILWAIRKAKEKPSITLALNPAAEMPTGKDVKIFPTSTTRLHDLPYF